MPDRVTIQLFILIMCILIVIQGTYLGYIVGVLTSIEKRFDISSSKSGTMLSAYDTGHTLAVLFVGYLYAESHKPRVIASGVFLSSTAMFLLSIPNFLFDTSAAAATPQAANLETNANYDNKSLSTDWMCRNSAHTGAYTVLLTGQLLAGVAAAPFNTVAYIYIDDNVSHRKSPFYLGLLTGMYGFGRAFGFLISAACTSLHTSFDVLNKEEHRAWWFGFTICGVLYVLFGLPLLLFPRKLANAERKSVLQQDSLEEDAPELHGQDRRGHLKGALEVMKNMPIAAWHLLTNPVYTSIMVGCVFSSYLIGGYGMYLPKYIETQFGQTPSMADIYSGIISTGSVAISTTLGGYLLNRFNIQSRVATMLLAITWTMTCLTYLSGMTVGCDQTTLHGAYTTDSRTNNFTTPCHSPDCANSTFEKFSPVCDGQFTYYSPCHAGCTDQAANGVWSNCQCTEHGAKAVNGLCPSDCSAFPVYMTIMFVGLFLGNLFFMATVSVMLRTVADRQRSLAISLAAFVTNIFGFIPGPIVFGKLVDSTCLVWRSPCPQWGYCAFYDNLAFRLRYHFGNAGFQLIAVMAAIFAYCKQRGHCAPPNNSNSYRKPTAIGDAVED